MSESGFRALSRHMFSLFGLQPDPLVLLILGFNMPRAAKVKVGSVPRRICSQLIYQHEQVKWEAEDGSEFGIPNQSFVGTGEPSSTQHGLLPFSGCPSLAISGPFLIPLPRRSVGYCLLPYSLSLPPHWSHEDSSQNHRVSGTRSSPVSLQSKVTAASSSGLSQRSNQWSNYCCHPGGVGTFAGRGIRAGF